MEPSRARRAIGLLDLTDLSDDATEESTAALCGRAAEHGTAAVCIWPDFVSVAASSLSGTPVRIATVVNFPTGDERAFAVGTATERALADGANEIDAVLPYRLFLTGEEARAAGLLATVRSITEGAATLKVILETGELGDAATIDRAARFAIEWGADFIKSSTGMSPVSATPAAVSTMLSVIAGADRPVGIKASGGIRAAADAETYLDLAAGAMGADWIRPETFRFGASGLLDALLAAADSGS